MTEATQQQQQQQHNKLAKSESVSNPMDCSLPDSSVCGISQARILGWVAIPFSRGSFLTQGSNLDLLYCRQILYCLSH